MSALLAVAVEVGGLLPASVMHSGPVRVLAAFVTINTVMYCALAVAKILPRLHPSTWFPSDNRRAQERSIHPDGLPPRSPATTSPPAPAPGSPSAPAPDPTPAPTPTPTDCAAGPH